MAERVPLPDFVLRTGIRVLVSRTDAVLRKQPDHATAQFARAMAGQIAAHTDAANAQHYELPAAFFEQVLGPHLKYSSCFYEEGDSLADAERRALALTAEHAGLHDGQRVLELGCGWGSLSLWLAERYPRSRIVAISNSASQRAFITARASTQGLANLSVITADINSFTTTETFDRIVSVEMFEHLSNWSPILRRMRNWLAPDGRAFLHVFAHDSVPYRFDHTNGADFIAQHFFTGGIMPSHALIAQFGEAFAVEREWRWSGLHYQRTAADWLANFDQNLDVVLPVLRSVYGADAPVWLRRWRLFFLATSGLFGHRGGVPWGVSHYRLRPV